MNSWTDKIRRNTVEYLEAHVGGRCVHVREEMLLVLRIAMLCRSGLLWRLAACSGGGPRS